MRLSDLRIAARNLRKAPGFTVSAIVTLAVATGANTAMFSAVDAVLLRPLPMAGPDRLVVIREAALHRGQAVREVSYRNFVDWRAQAASFDGMAAMGSVNWSMVLHGSGDPTRIQRAAVSASFFEMLGVRPILGRALRPEDDVRHAAPVVVLSHRLWQQRFGARPHVVGSMLTLDDRRVEVVGVMPAGFEFPLGAEAWMAVGPVLAAASEGWGLDTLESRGFGVLYVIARLKRGVSADVARAELDGVVRRLPDSIHPATGPDTVVLTPIAEQIFGQTRSALLVLFGAVCLVLLIACANVAGLLLARATARRREIAVKMALGATRRRIVDEWLAESVLLCLCASAGGVLLAHALLPALIALAPDHLPRLDEVVIDARVLAFTVFLCGVSVVCCGLAPAAHSWSTLLAEGLRDGRSAGGAATRRARSALIVVEVAIAMMMTVGAGLLVRSFVNLRQLDIGFDPERLLTVAVEPPADSDAGHLAAYDAMLERIGALPGVAAAGAVSLRPLAHGPIGHDSGYLLDDQRFDEPDSWKDNTHLNFEAVTPGYFSAMRVPLRRGRLFAREDTADAPAVAIVSESTARRLWPGQDAVGKRISVAAARSRSGEFPWQTVVGVVGDVRYRGLDDPRLDVYTPAAQVPVRMQYLVVRTSNEPLSATAAVRAAIREVSPGAVVEHLTTMDRIVFDAMAPWRFSMLLLGALASLGVTLTAVGLFGLVAYSVAQRRAELAVRLALGAQPRRVLWMVLWEGGRLAAAGLAAGAAGALIVVRLVSGLLFQVGAHDPITFGAGAVLLAAVATSASYWAARRVTRIDPLTALRAE